LPTGPPIWIKRSCLEAMRRDGERYRPLETGGLLLGYATSGGVVVRGIVLGGPKAVRGRDGFVPDAAWQEAELAKRYRASSRIDRYLGDWHTHPDGGMLVSHKDRVTARRIATAPEARAPKPLMLIMASEKRDWRAAAYQLSGGRFHICPVEPFDR
jgi:integrative and conjugative element protein (TIGR02256 family)